MSKTTWPITADAVTTAQPITADTHTGTTCQASQQHDAEQLAHKMKQRDVDDSIQLELLPQVHVWPEPTPTTDETIPDVFATTCNTPSPTYDPTNEIPNWTVMLRAFANRLFADYLDAKQPTPTHDGQAGGSDLHPTSLSNCPAEAAKTQPQSQPM